MTQLIKIKPAGRKLFALSILMTALLISVACSTTGLDEGGLVPPTEESTTSTSDSGAAKPASQSLQPLWHIR